MAVIDDIQKISETVWELPPTYKEGMRVPARIIATEKLVREMEEPVYQQISNVATLPGITRYALCMPDGHSGYGFPIGGVAAMDVREGGVISPGGIGFDINCGMRLVTTNLTLDDVQPHLREIVDLLFQRVPAGVGSHGFLKLSRDDFRKLVEQGARWCIEHDIGWADDLELTEENGCISGADASKISDRAVERGYNQVGTLGSGNHYLEVQVARPEDVRDKELAAKFGITIPNQIVVMFHCGSRGFGHQVATDYLQKFLKVMEPKYGIKILDRELACAPLDSPEGRDYFAAMKCGLNMSFANRQVILHRIREVFSQVFGRSAEDMEMRMVYDVAHNTAKLERHIVDGQETGTARDRRKTKDIARASERRDAGVRTGARRSSRALSRHWPAGDHRWLNGNRFVFARGHGIGCRNILQHGTRQRPNNESHQSAQTVARQTTPARPRSARHLCPQHVMGGPRRGGRCRLQRH